MTIKEDTIAPTSLVAFTPQSGINIVNDSTTFTLTADDGLGSGVSEIQYKINQSSWNTYSSPFDLSGYQPDNYLITYQAIDNLGNIESENTLLVLLTGPEIDTLPPGIPGYNLYILIGIAAFFTIILLKKKFMK